MQTNLTFMFKKAPYSYMLHLSIKRKNITNLFKNKKTQLWLQHNEKKFKKMNYKKHTPDVLTTL